MTHTYKTSGVCASEITYDLRDSTVHNVIFTNGCNGNGKGLGALLEGMEVTEVVQRLSGITCKNRSSSCPDQLAIALQSNTEHNHS